MKFCVVTPCLNAEKYIEQTLLSVLSQTILKDKSHSLTYIIKDGGSSDKSLEIIENIADAHSNISNVHISYTSQSDKGMYDAIVTGFMQAESCDIYSYINADDYYSQYAFEVISEIFTANNDVHFITGRNTWYNDKGHLVKSLLPYKYKKSLLDKGLYGNYLPFVQQESIFWDSLAHKNIDLIKLSHFKYAGDFYIWKAIIQDYTLYIVNTWIGGFRINKDQLSSRFIGEYREEMGLITSPLSLRDYVPAYVHKIIWRLPDKIKKRLSEYIFEYSYDEQAYRLTKR